MDKSTELFIKISHNIVENPKIVTLSCEARWAYLESLVYAARNFTDGLIDRRILHQRWSDTVIQELTNNDENPSWIMLDNGDVQIYAFSEWQMTAAKRAEIKEKRSRAGQISGAVRRETNTTGTRVQQVFEHNVNKNELELEEEIEIEKNKPLSANGRKTRLKPDWKPSEAILSTVAQKYPLVDITYESERFVNYWISTGTPMVDWGLTWQNWMLRKQKELADAAQVTHDPDAWMNVDVKWGPARYE